MTQVAPLPTPPGGVSRLQLLRDVVKSCTARRIRIDGAKVYVDLFTASAVVQVHDALSDANRERYIRLPWLKMVAMTWAVIERTKGKN